MRFLVSVCFSGVLAGAWAAPGEPGKESAQLPNSVAAQAPPFSYSVCKTGGTLVYDVDSIQEYFDKDSYRGERVSGTLKLTCDAPVGGEAKVLVRVKVMEYAVTDGAGQVQLSDLSAEEPMEFPYVVGMNGNPKLSLSDTEVRQLVGKRGNHKWYGRVFRGVSLALVGLPSETQEADTIGRFRWEVDFPFLARRQMACEAYRFQSGFMIVGRNLGQQRKVPTPKGKSGLAEQRSSALPDAFLVHFEDGRVKSGEYRNNFVGISMIVRVRERQD